MTTTAARVADATEAEAAAGSSWREVFACHDPRRVALVVVGLAAAVFSYEAVLVVVFDAREWWGRSLPGLALSYGVVFGTTALLAGRRAGDRRRLMVFLATGWVAMTLVSWLPRQRPVDWSESAQLAWWAGWVIAIYVAFPVAYAIANRQPVRSYGLRVGMFRGEARIFAVLLPVLVVGAYASAGQPRFQETYPFYTQWPHGPGSMAGLIAWWGMYALTFVALEFFFRGFLVAAGFRLIRWWAIPAMAAPYCLLHLDKPVPEMVLSLFGGLVLGVVALRTRSILAGVLAHVTLAVGTDAAVLLRR